MSPQSCDCPKTTASQHFFMFALCLLVKSRKIQGGTSTVSSGGTALRQEVRGPMCHMTKTPCKWGFFLDVLYCVTMCFIFPNVALDFLFLTSRIKSYTLVCPSLYFLFTLKPTTTRPLIWPVSLWLCNKTMFRRVMDKFLQALQQCHEAGALL